MGSGACHPGLEDTSDREANVPNVIQFSEDSLKDIEHAGACACWNLIIYLYNHSVRMFLKCYACAHLIIWIVQLSRS